jgi:hypothetical protein
VDRTHELVSVARVGEKRMTIVQFLTRADEVFVPVLTEFGNGITMGMLLLGILLVPVALYAVVDLFRK